MRDHNLLIPDIKAVRSITRFLGKLGITECYYDYKTNNPFIPSEEKRNYGWGLAETKRYVEEKYHYTPIKNSPLNKFEQYNELHEIKRTRQLMHMLRKFGLKLNHIPDSTLGPARQFVTRMRARR